MHHPLPVGLQAERVVQLVTLQQVLRQRGQSALQVAQGEALQWRQALSQAGPRQPGGEGAQGSLSHFYSDGTCCHNSNLTFLLLFPSLPW